MTDKELLEKTAKRLRVIADDTQRITSGNMSHNLTCLRGFALRAAESIERHLQEPVSEELEGEIKRYLHEVYDRDTTVGDIARYFANWQKEQFEKDCADLCNGIAAAKGLAVSMAYDKGVADAKEQLMAKAVDVTIAIPYQNGYGGYTQLVDSKETLPFGENLKVLVIKED